MHIHIQRYGNSDHGMVQLTKEPNDPRWRNDSHVLYHLKQTLRAQGRDVIKKRMWKDGHLMSDEQQYVRSRQWRNPGAFWIYDERYAVRDLAKELNRGSSTVLCIEWLSTDRHA